MQRDPGWWRHCTVMRVLWASNHLSSLLGVSSHAAFEDGFRRVTIELELLSVEDDQRITL